MKKRARKLKPKMKRRARKLKQPTQKSSLATSVPKSYRPEKIIDKIDLRDEFNKILYRVRWPNTWESKQNLLGCAAFNAFLDGIDFDANGASDDPLESDDIEEWEVQKILERRTVNRKVEYFVKWKDTWVYSASFKWLNLIHEYEQQHQCDSNETPKETATRSNMKRKRLHDTADVDVNEAGTSSRQATTENMAQEENADENDLRVNIDDDEITRIIELRSYDGENMFLFQRLNGENALIPTKVANIKYPVAVIDFYEQLISMNKNLIKKCS